MERLHALLAAALLACAGGSEGPASPRAGTAAVRAVPPGTGRAAAYPAALTIRVLRVSSRSGGGDAILVADSAATPARHILVDAGDDGAAAAALRELGVSSLDLMVLTHAHHDHYGGMDNILDAVPVRAFAFNGQPRTATTYQRLLKQVEAKVPLVIVVDTIRRIRVGVGDGATVVTLLPPLREYAAADSDDGEGLNEASLAVRVERGAFSFLTTGDAEDEANRHFANGFASLVDVDVLKVGHHGSVDATQPFWLDATTPDVAVVSANGTTHPDAEVLGLLDGRGIETYCTPQHGRVSIRVADDGAFAVHTAASPRRRCAPGSTS